MALTVAFRTGCSVKDILTDDIAPAITSSGAREITLDAYDRAVTLRDEATSYPRINTAVELSATIGVGGTVDIDLTAVPNAFSISADLDLTGKKLVGGIFRAAVGNDPAGVTVAPYGANDYDLFGGSQSRVFLPGEHQSQFLYSSSSLTNGKPTVAAGAKDIRISGAEDDEISILLVFGPA